MSITKFIFLQSESVNIHMKLSFIHACVVIILFFPLLAWPSLQPSPPWWTTMSATTTWAQWSPSRCIRHRRSPRPGTRRFPATCWGRKTSQGRFQAASSLHNRSSSHTFSSYDCVPAMIICSTLPGVKVSSFRFVVVLMSDSRIAEGPDWRLSCYFLFSCCLRFVAVLKTMSWVSSNNNTSTYGCFNQTYQHVTSKKQRWLLVSAHQGSGAVLLYRYCVVAVWPERGPLSLLVLVMTVI